MNLLRWSARALLVALVWACAGGAWAQSLPTLTIRSFSWTEQHQGNTRMPVTLSLSAANNERDVTGLLSATQGAISGVSPFALATPGASCVDGVDFVEILNQPFTIPRGALSTTIEVTICGDRVIEQDENFLISVPLATLVGARCPGNASSCNSVPTIVNDDRDTLIPVVRIDDLRISEPTAGTAEAVLTLRLSRPSTQDSTISFHSQADTAIGSAPNTLFMAGSCVGRNILNGNTVRRDFLPLQGSRVIPANTLTAEVRVTLCADGNATPEAQKRFFVVLTAASSNLNGIADGRGEVTILANGPAAIGSFQLSPDRARVRADAQQTYQLTWTMPPDRVWSELRSIDLRVGTAPASTLWVRWHALDDSFRLCRQGSDGDDDIAARISGIPSNGCSLGALPGSKAVLETRDARLHLAGTRAVGSGPAGRTVTLQLALSFKSQALGVQDIEVSAADAFGAVQPFTAASALRVLGTDGRP